MNCSIPQHLVCCYVILPPAASYMQIRRMTKDLQLGIPKPCSENWNHMSPEANGRFCSACQKTVLDFTAMDDNEILQWIANHQQGAACGRFRPDQLNRPIIIPPEKKNRWPYWHYLIAGLLFSSEVAAQTKPATPPMSQQIPSNPQNNIILGKIKAMPESKPSTDSIRGRVMDANGQPVLYASIKYKNAHVVVSDGNGYFSIPANRVSQQDTLFITAVGYNSVSIPVAQWDQTGQIQLILIPMKEAVLGDVSVVVTVRKRKPLADTLSIFKDTLAAIGLTKSALTIYPNPVAKGNSVTVAAKLDQTGTYTIQLFSIDGILMQTTQINGAPKTPTFSINIPGNMTPGTYIVRLSHPALTKCYTQQIVVF
jgi:hypothetical protein